MTREEYISHVKATSVALRRFLVALCCGDAALADDIAQETYLKTYLVLDSVTHPDRFAALLRRTAYTTFISHTRASRPSIPIEHVVAMSGETRTDEAFRYQELYTALDHLSEKERTAVLLFHIDGYSIKEIAQIIDSSPEAVKQQLSRGRIHLRTILSTLKPTRHD